MAFIKIKVNEISERNKLLPENSINLAGLFTTLTANDSGTYGGYVEMTGRDDKYLFIANNNGGNSISLTIHAGNGIQGTKNLFASSITSSSCYLCTLDSGRFKRITPNEGYVDNDKTIKHDVEGLNESNKVFITSNKSTCNVAVFKLN